ncbi:killer cell lectin-like receptor subfamily F member 1 isoform X3 [Grus americana]|uniref:killer cell lectin-like receptor subfamily F member 1 isoform X3 n=1 Tax=Grus americana TaxID=9117 RepID=UPI0024081A21|nr:killer cell lectin-like receptor subfamily F member 1 isoform X3 [Grus americana]
MSQEQGPAMAPTIIYAELNMPQRSAPGGCRKLPGPWWYWVLLGAGWVGTAVLVGVMLWLLQQNGGNGSILSQAKEVPASTCSWESCLTNTSQFDIPEFKCSLNCFRLQLRQRLCEQGNHHAAGAPACWLCPVGWQPFAAKCYWVSAKTKTWEAAVENCSHQRSQLAVLKSEEEMAFIKEMIQNTSAAWMGLSTNQTGGKTWMWQDGSPLQKDS